MMADNCLVNSVLITGANRGIGLEFVKQFASAARPPKYIFACARDLAKCQELLTIVDSCKGKADIRIVKLAVDKQKDIDAAVAAVSEAVGDEGLNLLINNAGVLHTDQTLGSVDFEVMLEAYRINAVAPLIISQAMRPLLKMAAAKKAAEPLSVSKSAIVMISTGVASIEDNKSGGKMGGYAYRCSKAALNMVGRTLSVDVKDDQILVVNILPGYVATDMTRHKGSVSVEESVSSMLATLSKLSSEHNGGFFTRLGETFPW